jgi:hypothetical protein
MVKNTLRLPRPYFLSPHVARRDPTVETSFACPSGHTVVMAVMAYLAVGLQHHTSLLVPAMWLMGACKGWVWLVCVAAGGGSSCAPRDLFWCAGPVCCVLCAVCCAVCCAVRCAVCCAVRCAVLCLCCSVLR